MALSVPLLILLLAPAAEREDAYALLERVIARQERNQERQRQYAFLETVTTEHLAGDGTVEKVESETFEVTPAPGGEYRRLVARNGRPLSPMEEQEEEEKFQKYLEEQLALSPEERKQNEERLKNRIGRFEARLRQAMEVFDFEPEADEMLDGRRVRVFSFTPRPEYEPRSRATKILHKLEGMVWVDPTEAQIVKLHLRFREDMKLFLGIFGRVSEGTEAFAEQQRIGGEDWMLDEIHLRLKGRLYFLKKYNRRVTYSYGDYRKFTVSTEETISSRE